MPPKRKLGKGSTSTPSKIRKVEKTKKKPLGKAVKKSAAQAKAKQTKKKPAKKKGKKAATPKQPVNKKEKATKAKGAKAVTTVACTGEYNLLGYLSEKVWAEKLQTLFEKDYFLELQKNLEKEVRDKAQIFPPQELVFNAFNMTPFNQLKVVLLGQDPYHDDGQAEGLSFSVPHGIPVPSSLRNIYKEVATDYPGFVAPTHGHLGGWAKQGVLLLNAALTVRAHEPNSHARFGWHAFTDDVIRLISDQATGLVFLLWGGFAHKKEKLIDQSKHVVIKTAHPSGLSYSKFRDCHCFKNVNKELKKLSKTEIDWTDLLFCKI